MKLNVNDRAEFDPWAIVNYILCEKIFISGMECKFGDEVPSFCDINHLHTHYRNGVVGTKEELDSLIDPIELYSNDPLMPIAMLV